jgi:hypothetical protein
MNGWRAFHGHMTKVISNFFQAPSSLTSAVSKIMAEIMEAYICNKFPLLMIGLLLEGAKPVVNAVLSQPLIPLGITGGHSCLFSLSS